jgi:hypothetical protein
MPRIATPSSLARVAIPALALAAVTSCTTGTPVAQPAAHRGRRLRRGARSAGGLRGRRVAVRPGRWYIDVKAQQAAVTGAGSVARSAK